MICLHTPAGFSAIGEWYDDFSQVPDEDGGVRLPGSLVIPDRAEGLIVFAHGSGSSRHSPRNQFVAAALNHAGLGTLLVDLLIADEELTRAYVFNIAMLAARLAGITGWLRGQPVTAVIPVGYFEARAPAPRRPCGQRRPTLGYRSRPSCPAAAARTSLADGWHWSGRPPC